MPSPNLLNTHNLGNDTLLEAHDKTENEETLHSRSVLIRGMQALLAKISSTNHHQLLGVDVLLECGLNVADRQFRNHFFLLRREGKGSIEIEVRDNLGRNSRIAGSRYFAGFQERFLGIRQLFRRWPTLDKSSQFFKGSFFNSLHVDGVRNRIDGEASIISTTWDRNGRRHSIRQSFLLPNAVSQSRRKRSSAKDKIAKPQSRTVGMIFIQWKDNPAKNTALALSGVTMSCLAPVSSFLASRSICDCGTFEDHLDRIGLSTSSA